VTEAVQAEPTAAGLDPAWDGTQEELDRYLAEPEEDLAAPAKTRYPLDPDVDEHLAADASGVNDQRDDAEAVNGRTFKYFRCHRCGDERADYEVTGIGDREYCKYPDHTPRLRVYRMYSRWRFRVWLKPWLPRSYWNA